MLSTVGYGDIYPITNYEKFFSVLVQLLGCMVFGTLTGALASHNVNASIANKKVEEELEKLQELFSTNSIPLQIQEKVKRFAKKKYEKSALDEEELL